jgi:hypothetical protein
MCQAFTSVPWKFQTIGGQGIVPIYGVIYGLQEIPSKFQRTYSSSFSIYLISTPTMGERLSTNHSL